MRTVLTMNDIKNVFKNIFTTSDKLDLCDENGNLIKEVAISDYLNIDFYTWKNRLVETDGSRVATYEEWLESLTYTLDKSYALIELNDSTITPSQDIDSATLSGKITFLIQTNKVNNLDYFVSKLRNEYIGNPQEIQTGSGNILTTYIGIGILLYDEDPEMTNMGETCIVSLNFSFTYINEVLNYSNTTFEFSFDDTTYYRIPFIKATIQDMATPTNIPKLERPDITGYIMSSWSQNVVVSFYDFNLGFTKLLNQRFWSLNAISINGTDTTKGDVNIPIYAKVTSDGNVYKYKYVLGNMEKVVSNGDFNVCSMTLKTWGK